MKVSAAGAAGAAAMTGFDWTVATESAFAADLGLDPSTYDTFHTTCPYCSAQCGQIVAVATANTKKVGGDPSGLAAGTVIDIYGDKDSPINNGGLCAKGAGSYQLATNPRRLGAWSFASVSGNPYGSAPSGLCFDPSYVAAANDPMNDGIAWKRLGNNAWEPMKLQDAFDEIVKGDAAGDNSHIGLKAIRNASVNPAPGLTTAVTNARSVQFFGSSHVNNEANYLYRKIIANFGTSLTEHQARI